MLPESGCKSKKENLKRGCFRYITIYLTFIQTLLCPSFEAQKSRYKIQKTPYIKTLWHVLDMIEAPFQMLTTNILYVKITGLI